MNFDIGQRVRIVGPDNFNRLCHLGECFVIEEKDNPAWGWIDRKRPYGYSRHGCPHIFPASSLELAEPESDSTNPSLTGHPIEEVKRTPPEEFQNVEGARLDLSGEFTALRSVKLGGALDGCGLSVGPEREPIGILKQREQELQAEYDKLMEAA